MAFLVGSNRLSVANNNNVTATTREGEICGNKIKKQTLTHKFMFQNIFFKNNFCPKKYLNNSLQLLFYFKSHVLLLRYLLRSNPINSFS